jgi:hypothetical protein
VSPSNLRDWSQKRGLSSLYHLSPYSCVKMRWWFNKWNHPIYILSPASKKAIYAKTNPVFIFEGMSYHINWRHLPDQMSSQRTIPSIQDTLWKNTLLSKVSCIVFLRELVWSFKKKMDVFQVELAIRRENSWRGASMTCGWILYWWFYV